MFFPVRKSLRLSHYDYSQGGYYFVTVCVQVKHNVFGQVVNGVMTLNDVGHAVRNVWKGLECHYSHCRLDEHVIMPDHIHGIIEIVGAGSPGPNEKGGETPPLRNYSLSDMMGYFKYQSTKQINVLLNCPGKTLWQRSFYDHIIRNEQDLKSTREYIVNNPIKWGVDERNIK